MRSIQQQRRGAEYHSPEYGAKQQWWWNGRRPRDHVEHVNGRCAHGYRVRRGLWWHFNTQQQCRSPSSINLSDNAAAENLVSFGHKGSDLILNGGHSFEVFNGGALAIFSDSNMSLNSGGPFIYVPSPVSSVLLGAVGTLNFNGGSFSLPNNDLGLAAATVQVGSVSPP